MPRMSAGSHTNGKALRTFDVENVNADAAALTTEKFLCKATQFQIECFTIYSVPIISREIGWVLLPALESLS